MKRAPRTDDYRRRKKGLSPHAYSPDQHKVVQPKIDYRSEQCKDCGAEIGKPCVSENGKVLQQVHITRKRMVIRHHNAAREAAGTFKATEGLFERGSKETDDESVPICPRCNLRIKLTPSGKRASHTPFGGARSTPHHDFCPGSGEQIA